MLMWVLMAELVSSGVWNKCSLKNHLDRNALHIPPPAPLPGIQDNFPYIIVGDEGFPLSEKLLISYPGLSAVE